MSKTSIYETGRFKIAVDKELNRVTVTDKNTGLILSDTIEPILPAKPSQAKADGQATAYLVAIVSMVVIGLASFLGISYLRPTDDVTVIGSVVFGFVTLSTIGLFQFIKSLEAKEEAREARIEAIRASTQSVVTHDTVNSRITAMNLRIDEALQKAVDLAFERGKSAERESADQRADKLRGLDARLNKIDSLPSEGGSISDIQSE